MNATVFNLQVLITARAIISSPEHWTQGAYARSKERIECDVDDGESFCSIGAIKRAIGVIDPYSYKLPYIRFLRSLLNKAASEIYPEAVPPAFTEFNDRESTTHDMILRVFDRAIENLSANGGNNDR